jgi:hypothetical protein
MVQICSICLYGCPDKVCALLQDPELDTLLRMQVPRVFVFATMALAVLSFAVLGFHYSMGHFSNYRGISLFQEELVSSSLVQVPSSSRKTRVQGLKEEQKEGGDDEDDEDAIRFENDWKMGGGDLMVPISMVDYENLGEGSIVDQVHKSMALWPRTVVSAPS